MPTKRDESYQLESAAVRRILSEAPRMAAVVLAALWDYRIRMTGVDSRDDPLAQGWLDLVERAGKLIEQARSSANDQGGWPREPLPPRVWPIPEQFAGSLTAQRAEPIASPTATPASDASRSPARQSDTGDVMTVRQAADLAGCSEFTMVRGLRTGYYPGSKHGRGWRVSRSLLEARLAEIAAAQTAQRRGGYLVNSRPPSSPDVPKRPGRPRRASTMPR